MLLAVVVYPNASSHMTEVHSSLHVAPTIGAAMRQAGLAGNVVVNTTLAQRAAAACSPVRRGLPSSLP